LKVKKSLETPNGTVVFEGEITPDELDLILSVGLNYLLQQGAIPLKVLDTKDAAKLAEGSQELQ
jgi:hypothetical protein